MTHNALDDPIWAALTTEHARLAEGSTLAKRYPPDISPLAAMIDQSDAAKAALRPLVPPGGRVALFALDTVQPPPGLEIEWTASMEQMVATQEPADTGGPDICTLSDVDAEGMRALVALTNPGPFGARTHIFGRFLGIRLHQELVAMAGERLRFNGHMEISGICVHPGHRRKGYARLLIAALMRRALQDGLGSFLHVYSDNAAAIALYKQLKFEVRRQLRMTMLRHAR